jgi:hypothetical protein
MTKEELTKKALSFIKKHKNVFIEGELEYEDYGHLIFDIVREGVAVVNEVIEVFEKANISTELFKKQFDERYCIDGSAIYNKEKISLIRVCPESDIKEFVADCYVTSNALADCKVEKVVVKDNVKSMGSGVFKNCRNLREVVFENGETGLDNFCFEGCPDELIIKAPAGGYVEEYAKQYNLKLETI